MDNKSYRINYSENDYNTNGDKFDTGEQPYTYINGLGFIPETPQQLERKQLVLQYNVLLLAVLLFYLLRSVVFLPTIRVLALFKLGISVNPMTGMVSVANPIIIPIVDLICYVISMTVPILIILGFSKKTLSFSSLFAAPRQYTIRYGLIILIGTSVIANAVSESFFEVLKSGGLVILENKYQMQTTPVSWVIYLVAIVLIPAVFEEILFRGVVLRCLRRFGDLVAIIVSTTLFTLIQPTTSMMIYSFIMGLMLSYFALKSGSIVLPIIANFSIRGINVLIWIIQTTSKDSASDNLTLLFSLIMLIASTVAFFHFIKNDYTAFSINMDDTFLTNRTKLRYLFTNVGFWMLVVLAFICMLPNMEIIN